MPFKSEAQRRYLWLKHPDIAKRWAAAYPGQHNLPYHVGTTGHANSDARKVKPVNALAVAAKKRTSSKKPSGPMPKLGSGARFEALKNKLAHRPGVKNPAALAAAIGRKKYGAKKMASMAAKGR